MFLYLSQKEQTSSLCTCVLNTVLLHKLFVYSCLSFCWYVSSTNMPFNNVVLHTKDSEYISLMKPFKYRVELTKRKPTTIQLSYFNNILTWIILAVANMFSRHDRTHSVSRKAIKLRNVLRCDETGFPVETRVRHTGCKRGQSSCLQ